MLFRSLRELGAVSETRVRDGRPFVTDNGNWILDAQLRPPLDARALEQAICALPGVLGTGFFLGLADAVIIGSADEVDVRRRSS